MCKAQRHPTFKASDPPGPKANFRRVVTGQEMVRKFLQGHGKVREIYFVSGEIDILKKSQGKLNYLTRLI